MIVAAAVQWRSVEVAAVRKALVLEVVETDKQGASAVIPSVMIVQQLEARPDAGAGRPNPPTDIGVETSSGLRSGCCACCFCISTALASGMMRSEFA